MEQPLTITYSLGRMLLLATLSLACVFPHLVHAGTATFSEPGTYSFTVPQYGTLTVELWGGGGGGGAAGSYNSGSAGGASTFADLRAGGGGGGGYSYNASVGSPGTGGVAEGGDINSSGQQGAASPQGNGGGSTSGGAGGARACCDVSGGAAGAAPGGGGGGALGLSFYGRWAGGGGGGGYVSKTYPAGQLMPGSVVSVTVGAGGFGGHYYAMNGGPGAPGAVVITWSSAAATCSVSFSQNPIHRGGGSTLSWSSSNADQWTYIRSVGYVGTSGSAYVAPSSTTDYSCYAQGSGGSDGWHNAILTVTSACPLPWGGSLEEGESVTAYLSPSVSSGASCVSQTRTCSGGSLSGTYQYASCPSATSCTLDGVTVPHGESRAFFSSRSAPYGSSCSAVSGTRTCADGVLSGSNTYQYASCGCVASYSCSGNDIVYTNSSCATSVSARCVAPSYCSPGVSSCVNPAPDFAKHLRAAPSLVRAGQRSRLYWDVSNVQRCTVSGGGLTWDAVRSAASGEWTDPIEQRTEYTLRCVGFDGSFVEESVTVNIAPSFYEL